MSLELSRRGMLQAGAAVGGGLLLRMWIPGDARAEEAPPRVFTPNAFLRIGKDKTTFFVSSTEMGQGVATSLSLLVCEELELDPAQLDFQFAPAARAFDNPEIGGQVTGGSSSVRTMWAPLRSAGAIAREMLKKAAAESWSVPVSEVTAHNGAITHPSGKTAKYGELADKASEVSVSHHPPLKKDDQYELVGKYAGPRLDVPRKVDGSAVFGIDVKIPELRVAVVVRPPVIGATVKSFDEKAARAVPGVEDVVQIASGVAVVAKTYWHARQGAERLGVSWDLGPNAQLSSNALLGQFKKLVAEGDPKIAKSAGDAKAAIAGSAKRISAAYETPYLAHAPMEPMNATARVTEDKCEIWCGTQSQTNTKGLASRLTGLSLDQVEVHTTYAGGGFGRRSMMDFIPEPIILSQKLKKPIKVVWSREDDTRGWQYRHLSYHELEGGLDANGDVTGVVHKIACQSLLQVFKTFVRDILPDGMPGFMKSAVSGMVGGIMGSITDPTSVEGSANGPYELANHRVELYNAESPIPIAPWRSVGNSFNGFVVESFIDELAHAAGKDPYEFRRALLKFQHRNRWVLELVADKIGWNTRPPPGVFRGIAQHASFKSYAAAAAEVSIEDGEIKVHRIVTALDCGQVVHPDNVKAQLESAAIFGLSQTLKQKLTLENGAILQSNFHDYEVMRMFDSPKIEAYLAPNHAAPTGVGECGVPPIAPAVANAVFAATGKRLRRLPLSLSDA